MRFSRSVLLTNAAHFVVNAVAVAVIVLQTRTLGADGKGVLTALLLGVATVVQFANIGLSSAGVYFIKTKKENAPAILSTLTVFAILFGIVLASAVWVLFQVSGGGIMKGVERVHVLPVVLIIPAALANTILPNLYLAYDRVKMYNGVSVGKYLVLLAATYVVLFPLEGGVTMLIWTLAALSWVESAVYAVTFLPFGLSLRLDFSYLTGMIKYGFKAYAANFMTFLILMSDQFFVNIIRDEGELGVYSVSAGLANRLWVAPAIVGSLLFPKIAGSSDSGEFTSRVTRHTVLFMIFELALVAVFAKLIVSIFGPEFPSAVYSLWYLLPGIFFFGVAGVMLQDLAGRGIPPVALVAPAAALVLNVALNFLLIPRYGQAGAAVASSFSYFLLFILITGYFMRKMGRTAGELFMIRPYELSALLTLRVFRRKAAAAEGGGGAPAGSESPD